MRPLLIAGLLSLGAIPTQAEMVRYELDPGHTVVYFTVDHIGYAKTLGVFTEVEGGFSYDAATQTLSGVDVTINAVSVETFNAARDNHVRNQDFLDVSQFPEIVFVAESGTPESDTSGTVTGDLTLLGETRPVTLAVTLNKTAPYPFGHGREVLGLSLETSIQRSDFGMSYAVENGLVGDVVDIKVETEAIRSE
ncbi:MAG: YceI family protein [Pseudomonadota bacterium]